LPPRAAGGRRDEDGKLRRVGSLERDKPISAPIETLKHRSKACFGTPRRSAREETRHWSRRGVEGEYPGGLKTQERIGSDPAANHRRPEYGLPGRAETPEDACERGRALARDEPGRSSRATTTSRGSAEPAHARTVAQRPSTTTSRGAWSAERHSGAWKGNPLEGEPHERRRHETRPAWRRAESRHQEAERSLEVQHSRVRQTRRRSLPDASNAEGGETPGECAHRDPVVQRDADTGERSGSGHTLKPREVHERMRSG
jgi:hypothetical protein